MEFGRGRAADLEGVTIWEYELDGDDTLGFGAHGEPDQTFPASITLRCGNHLVTITVDPDTGETTIGDVLTAADPG